MASSSSLDLIQEHMLGFPRVKCSDELRWLLASDRIFFVHLALQSLSMQRPHVPGHRLIWHGYGIPSHAFIFWLAIRERLSSLDCINRYLSFYNNVFFTVR